VQIVSGLTEDDVETVIPYVGGKVIVVSGKHIGCTGKIVEINKDKYRAYVDLDAENNEVKFDFEDICEYVPISSNSGGSRYHEDRRTKR
jgi:ribosomal protein S4E